MNNLTLKNIKQFAPKTIRLRGIDCVNIFSKNNKCPVQDWKAWIEEGDFRLSIGVISTYRFSEGGPTIMTDFQLMITNGNDIGVNILVTLSYDSPIWNLPVEKVIKIALDDYRLMLPYNIPYYTSNPGINREIMRRGVVELKKIFL